LMQSRNHIPADLMGVASGIDDVRQKKMRRITLYFDRFQRLLE